MIAFIRGRLAAKSPNAVVVECNGLGYEAMAPLTVTERLPPIGEETLLLTEFVVREDSQTLYGFLEERDRRLFRRLIKVGGVGAKTALAMMSAMTTAELLGAISADDLARLSQIPGIGKKTAERLIVDFRGSDLLTEAAVVSDANREAEQALAALGYNRTEIRRALSHAEAGEGTTTADLVRAALRALSPRK